MLYSIGEVSKIINLSISTLRYYDKEGLLPNVKRDSSGIRKFSEEDIRGLKIIECLKNSGMPIKNIKQFLDWCSQGDSTLTNRLNMFEEQENNIINQIKTLEQTLDVIKYKKWYYQTAINDKTEQNVKNIKSEDMPKDIQKLYKKI